MVSDFREQYPIFTYKSFSLEKSGDVITAAFNFSIEGLCDFSPRVSVNTANLTLVNPFDSPQARRIVFYLGMVEAVSYLKAVCPRTVMVEADGLSEYDKQWFKKLWFNGLGEFFHINSMSFSLEDFVEIKACEPSGKIPESFVNKQLNIIPVGGGKDSCVTAELLSGYRDENLFLTVNDQQARTDCVKAAGYAQDKIIRVNRTISPELLELNKKGFYNGHTPFSAIVAFVSLYCAYITGGQYIVLSNEASANEGNTESGVNHQYSKSFEFEKDFSDFVSKNITGGIQYFSLLRPFNELQIAKYFTRTDRYLEVFRSCNKGSKKNEWCCNCPKCLFVYGMLSPFVGEEKLTEIFGSNLFENEALLAELDGLCGITPVKPFECVGTAKEFVYAISVHICRLKKSGKKLPPLLKYADSVLDTASLAEDSGLLEEFNGEHLVPAQLAGCITEMKNYVSTDN